MEVYKKIIGHEKIIEKFGYWPSFHDAEVLSMQFNREQIKEEPGPSLVACIHAFEMTSELDEKGHYKFTKHCLITFEFDNVEELELNGFNHQNAIFGLVFEESKDANGLSIFVISFDPAFGVECKFQCRMVRVSSVKDGKPKNSVYK